jgi:hypothetical protein
MCIERDRDFFVERFGRLRATLMMWVLVVGGLLRAAYYAVRVARSGQSAQAYRAMQPEVNASLRILVRLMFTRH